MNVEIQSLERIRDADWSVHCLTNSGEVRQRNLGDYIATWLKNISLLGIFFHSPLDIYKATQAVKAKIITVLTNPELNFDLSSELVISAVKNVNILINKVAEKRQIKPWNGSEGQVYIPNHIFLIDSLEKIRDTDWSTHFLTQGVVCKRTFVDHTAKWLRHNIPLPKWAALLLPFPFSLFWMADSYRGEREIGSAVMALNNDPTAIKVVPNGLISSVSEKVDALMKKVGWTGKNVIGYFDVTKSAYLFDINQNTTPQEFNSRPGKLYVMQYGNNVFEGSVADLKGLYLATQQGNVQLVKDLIRKCRKLINTPHQGYENLIHLALEQHHHINEENRIEVLKTLLQYGVHVNQPLEFGSTALWVVASGQVRNEHIDEPLIRLFLDRGAIATPGTRGEHGGLADSAENRQAVNALLNEIRQKMRAERVNETVLFLAGCRKNPQSNLRLFSKDMQQYITKYIKGW
ncbi:MAG: hypothetical protein LLF94_09655 [Chlamydiales bacterium]|nr:hypothetical protein [Chlamydiales bacterium]